MAKAPKPTAADAKRLASSPQRNVDRVAEQVRQENNARVRAEVMGTVSKEPAVRKATAKAKLERLERNSLANKRKVSRAHIKETLGGINAIGEAAMGKGYKARTMKGRRSTNIDDRRKR